MTADAKKISGEVAATVGVTVAVFIVGLYYADNQLAARATPKSITLTWDKNDPDPATLTEVWASSNLTTWTLKTNVAGTNRVTLPATNRAEFFKIRNRLGSQVSDWSRKR